MLHAGEACCDGAVQGSVGNRVGDGYLFLEIGDFKMNSTVSEVGHFEFEISDVAESMASDSAAGC